MNSKICEILGIEFPLLAFSHCKDVVAQVSKAGGMGVLGAVGMTPEILEQELNQEDSVVVKGKVKKEPRAIGGYELGVNEVCVINHTIEEYPISKKDHGTDFLMSNRHLWLRSKRQNSIMRVRHQIVKAIRDYFDDNGFNFF